MRQQYVNKLGVHDRTVELQRVRTRISRALNLFGGDVEPVSDLDTDDITTLDRAIANLLTPECHHRKGSCDHAFPAWFVRESGAARLLRAYRSLWLQVRRAQGE